MAPSYPNCEWASPTTVRFMIPDRLLVRKIIYDSREEEEDLRIKAAGTILFNKADTLHTLLSRHYIRVEDRKAKELQILCSVAPLPCSPPKLPRYIPKLERIPEAPEEEEEYGWIRVYQYIPKELRHCPEPSYSIRQLNLPDKP